MSQNVSRCPKMSKNVEKCLSRLWEKMVGNDWENSLNTPNSSKSLPNCPKMSQNVPSCPKLSKVVQSCPKLSKVVQSCPKMSQNVPKCPLQTHPNGLVHFADCFFISRIAFSFRGSLFFFLGSLYFPDSRKRKRIVKVFLKVID